MHNKVLQPEPAVEGLSRMPQEITSSTGVLCKQSTCTAACDFCVRGSCSVGGRRPYLDGTSGMYSRSSSRRKPVADRSKPSNTTTADAMAGCGDTCSSNSSTRQQHDGQGVGQASTRLLLHAFWELPISTPMHVSLVCALVAKQKVRMESERNSQVLAVY
jgi:hypothetical protein